MIQDWPPAPRKGKKFPTVEYRAWNRMWTRTTDTSNPRWVKYYSSKGIVVCERWRKFANFFSDMGKRPAKGLSVERIDREQGYSPENCKWATHREQMLNRSITRWITYAGETKCFSDWARSLGMSKSSLGHRLKILPLEEALMRPKRKYPLHRKKSK